MQHLSIGSQQLKGEQLSEKTIIMIDTLMYSNLPG